MNSIPIENIYYMILYAWNKVNNKDLITNKGMENIDSINNLIVELFLIEVARICKKGLYGEYVDNDHATEYIKGKINIKESIYLIEPKMGCRYDEFSRNNKTNKILKAILNKLYFMQEINNKSKKKIRSLLLEFHEIENMILEEKDFKTINYNRLNRDYKFPIDLGYLIYMNSIPTEEEGINKFIEINRDEETMSSIFEEFLRNFYKRHTDYQIRSRNYTWDVKPLGNSNMNLIPLMKTDIEIERPKEKIIRDAKYYKDAFTCGYGIKKFISSHMFQITAYLRKNINNNESRSLRGILIYPSNGYNFSERFISKEGYTIEFKTINLNNKWYEIE